MKNTQDYKIRKTLWATDFSRESQLCLPYVEFFAKNLNTENHAVYVLPKFSDWIYEAAFFSLEDLHTEIQQTKNKSIAKIESIGKTREVSLKPKILEGIASEKIIGFAEENSIDIIFAGRRGISEIEQILVGSTTARLIRNSKVPVFVVPKARKKPAIKRILSPIDLNELSLHELKYSISLARQLNCELVVTHIAEFFNYKIPMLKRQQIIEKINMHIEKVAKELDYEVKNIIHEIGEPAHKIIDIAQNEKIDLIVMATNQRKGLEKFLLGSITQKVLLASTIPILVLPPNSYGRPE